MSISSAIQNAQTKVANAYTAVNNKGGTLPSTQNLSNLPATISTIPSGTTPTLTSLTVTPSTTAQTITPPSGTDGYNTVQVSAVTASIDSNIQSQYIRCGVEILGVAGNYGMPVPSTKVACSGNTTWYSTSDGELYGCGSNGHGQQGSGDKTNVTTFTKRADNVADVVCSEDTTWYIDSSGNLYGCGYGYYGQQGNGSTSNSADVKTFTKRADNVVNVACSKDTTWYVNILGELYGCGYNGQFQQGSGNTTNVITFTQRATNVKKVACSVYTTWYINNDGELYGCGSVGYGQQGSGTLAIVKNFTKRADNVIDVTCTNDATWYIDSSGNLYGCGRGTAYQQGNNSTSDVTTFTLRGTNVKKVVCDTDSSGNGVTWYLTNDGYLYGCGYGSYGQQGNGSTSDVTTFTLRATNVKDIFCAYSATWYISNDGNLYGCGFGYYGQQGNGLSSSSANVNTFTQRATNVKSVSCSTLTTWYANNNNEIYGCGRGNYGQQGSGNTSNVLTFTKRN